MGLRPALWSPQQPCRALVERQTRYVMLVKTAGNETA